MTAKKPDRYEVQMPKDKRVAKIIEWMNDRARQMTERGDGPADIMVLSVVAVHALFPKLPLKKRTELSMAASTQMHEWLKLHNASPIGTS